ncbi:MAG TPA: DNA sulfur modification protein DndB [Gemmataceae bacterium]|nr:DNA sulfur modification protein DndB [Gemmataceae bacterium]
MLVLDDVLEINRYGRVAKYVTKINVARIDEYWAAKKIGVDNDLQRGEKVTIGRNGEEKRTPMLDRKRVEEMASKIIEDGLHGGALCWNLRDDLLPRYEAATRRLLIYGNGSASLPDSVHRTHAALLALRRVLDTGVNVDVENYEFPLIIERLDDDGERVLFYEYNMLGKHANQTRSRWINNVPPPNRVATELVERSQLRGHVEIVTNNISLNSPKVTTFNVLASSIEDEFPDLDDESIEPVAAFIVQFFDALIRCRPEVGYLPLGKRKEVRERSIADSALAFKGYIGVAAALYERFGRHGSEDWRSYTQKLGEPYRHTDAAGQIVWEGDLFSRRNPLWQGQVLVNRSNGKVSLLNRRETRAFMRETLLKVIALPPAAESEDPAEYPTVVAPASPA